MSHQPLGRPIGNAPPTIVTTDAEDAHSNPFGASHSGPHAHDAPGSPTPTYSSLDSPSAPVASSLLLRSNHPDSSSGLSSLPAHQRSSSNATVSYADEKVNPLSEKFSRAGTETIAEDNITPVKRSGTGLASLLKGRTQPEDDALDKQAEQEEKEEQEKQFRLDVENEAQDDPTPFQVRPKKLASLVDPKSVELLTTFGGIEGVLAGLGTDSKRGLDASALSGSGGSGAAGANAEARKRVYGSNVLPVRPPKSLLRLMWMALQDKVLIILLIAAVISLVLGVYTTVGTPAERFVAGLNPDGSILYETVAHIDWVEGVAILIAVFIVVMVGSVNDWQKEKQFAKLNAKKEDRGVKVIRSGQETVISIYDVLVGDIALLEPGEIVPVDGIFLRGHGLRCDESGATGESDAIKKTTYDECMAERDAHVGPPPLKGFKGDCFMISGGKVLEGVGEYLVIAIGPNSFNGRTMMALRGETPPTQLQLKLNALAELIAKLGSLAGLILFTSLMIRFFVQLGTGTPVRNASQKGQAFIDILIISVTVVVVAVPEGLPLAVTLALAFATKRMTKEHLLVRLLGACETMANATVVCTDKTGTLTQNVMSVVAGSIGVHGKFVQRLGENANRTNANATHEEDGKPISARAGRADFSIEMSSLNDVLSPAAQQLFNEALVLNSTAFEDTDPETGKLEFVGSKTETALLRFAQELGWKDYKSTREAGQIVQMIPFSSERKSMGVVVKLPNGKHRLYMKGASEILLRMSTRHILVSEQIASQEVESAEFTAETRENIDRTIILYANNMLRTIAVCYKDLESFPPANLDDNGEAPFSWLARDLTLIAVTGIEDPLRPGVTAAVAVAAKAGVGIKMVTGDNVLTARSIAIQCGIFSPGGIILEGPVFRALSKSDLHELAPRIQVIARSSPEDKKLLVQTLQDLGEIVGVTGDGTNDGPALKQADVGFAMGIAGTEVAKEASDIILMTDDFPSLITAVKWGRCVNDSVRKFLQFQLSVNVTAVLVTYISAVSSTTESSVLSAVQLLWVNLIMDTFAALALATDPADTEVLDRKPDRKTAPLISIDMFKMILIQAAFQIISCLVLHFRLESILGQDCGGIEFTCRRQADERSTVVFGTFVFCQIFNMINCRRLDRRLNIFRGILNNFYFLGILGIMVGGQILIMFFGGAAFGVVRINGRDWAICIIIGCLSIPLGALVRLLPTGPFAQLLFKLRIYNDPSKLPTESPAAEEKNWNEAITKAIGDMSTYQTIRGGRMRSSNFVLKSRRAQMKAKGIQPTSLLAMIPTLIASAVGAQWQPSSSDFEDPAGADPSASSAALASGKIQIHPDTDKSDPLYERFHRA